MSINFPFDSGSTTQSGTFQLNSNYFKLNKWSLIFVAITRSQVH